MDRKEILPNLCQEEDPDTIVIEGALEIHGTCDNVYFDAERLTIQGETSNRLFGIIGTDVLYNGRPVGRVISAEYSSETGLKFTASIRDRHVADMFLNGITEEWHSSTEQVPLGER